jgi:hypothetical protein
LGVTLDELIKTLVGHPSRTNCLAVAPHRRRADHVPAIEQVPLAIAHIRRESRKRPVYIRCWPRTRPCRHGPIGGGEGDVALMWTNERFRGDVAGWLRGGELRLKEVNFTSTVRAQLLCAPVIVTCPLIYGRLDTYI